MSALKTALCIIGAIYSFLAVLASFDLIDVHTCISNAGKCPSYAQSKDKQ
ncbi:hypothetical protein [Caballeronia glathei]|nr:hypothetical protein [Caballeronia glathei]